MKKRNTILTILFYIFFILKSISQTNLSQVVISGGGTEISNGVYTFNVTIGQPLVSKLTDENSEACIGFWHEIKEVSPKPFKVEKFVELLRPSYQRTGFISELKVYPNPFKDFTNFEFTISEIGHTKLYITDVQGRVINNLISRNMDTGTYRINFRGQNLEQGIYTAVLVTSENIITKLFIKTE